LRAERVLVLAADGLAVVTRQPADLLERVAVDHHVVAPLVELDVADRQERVPLLIARRGRVLGGLGERAVDLDVEVAHAHRRRVDD
jgi:hypothetical protein